MLEDCHNSYFMVQFLPLNLGVLKRLILKVVVLGFRFLSQPYNIYKKCSPNIWNLLSEHIEYIIYMYSCDMNFNIWNDSLRRKNEAKSADWTIDFSLAMWPGLKIRHFCVAKSLFLTIIFYRNLKGEIFCSLSKFSLSSSIAVKIFN